MSEQETVVSSPHEFTFKDTGVRVKIKKVSPLLVAELQKDFPPPTPPMQEVDYGDGKKVKEPNPASPEYQRMLSEYNRDFEMKMRTLVMKRGVEIELSEEQLKEVADLRAFYKEEYDKELLGDDRMVYLSHIAIGSDDDMTDLINAIMRRSQPMPEDIEKAKVSFRS